MYPSPVLENIVSHYRVAALLTRRVTDMVVEKKKDAVAGRVDQRLHHARSGDCHAAIPR